jgi:hypothetical protein
MTAGTQRTPASSAHRAASDPAPALDNAAASAEATGGEFDLLAYARKKLGGTETT